MRKYDLDELNTEYVNMKFGYLTVLSVFRDSKCVIRFRCKCDCGTIKDIKKNHVLSGSITSCGCYKKSPEFANLQRLYFINNPSARSYLGDAQRSISLNKRANSFISTNCSDLLLSVHPDYINDLLSGNLKSYDFISTKCPLCGNYSLHTINNVLRFENLRFRYNHPPLCKNCIGVNLSSCCEQEIVDYISTFYSGELVRNSRNIISPLEIDLYYPEKKIAVEFNGDYWHSDKFKSNDYHYNKFRKCLERGIILVSVFESFWRTNSISIKSYLYDLFNSRINSLSMIDSYTMNNNYPRADIFSLSISDDYDIDSYTFSNYNIYTCGSSKVHSV